MTRLNLILMAALILSSIYLVRVSYDERRLYAALDRAQTEQRQLETEYGRLQAEQQAQSSPTRIDKLAREKLRMLPATSAIVPKLSVPGLESGGRAVGNASALGSLPSSAVGSAVVASQVLR